MNFNDDTAHRTFRIRAENRKWTSHVRQTMDKSLTINSIPNKEERIVATRSFSFSFSLFVRQVFYKIRHNYSNIKILARKLTRKPYGLMIVSSILKYTVLNNLTYDLLTHNQNKYTIS